jgi:hypothetical protein
MSSRRPVRERKSGAYNNDQLDWNHIELGSESEDDDRAVKRAKGGQTAEQASTAPRFGTWLCRLQGCRHSIVWFNIGVVGVRGKQVNILHLRTMLTRSPIRRVPDKPSLTDVL